MTGGQSQPTKSSLSVSEALERAHARRNTASPPAKETKAAIDDDHAQDHEGLNPDETNPDDGESDAGEGQDGEVDDLEDASAADEDDPLYTVTVDGVEYEVPLSELLAGYSRNQDYTKKTQALATQRQEIEATAEAASQRQAELDQQLASVAAEKEQYDRALTALNEVLGSADREWENVDWEALEADDPIEAGKQYRRYQQHKERKATVESELRRREGERRKEAETRHSKAVQTFQQEIAKHFPQWKDPAVRAKDWGLILKVAADLKFTPDEIKNTTDARIFRLLYKAMRYDQSVEARAKAKNPAPKAGQEPARVVSPSGARPSTRAGTVSADAKGAMDRFRKAPTIAGAAEAMRAARQAQAKAATRR